MNNYILHKAYYEKYLQYWSFILLVSFQNFVISAIVIMVLLHDLFNHFQTNMIIMPMAIFSGIISYNVGLSAKWFRLSFKYIKHYKHTLEVFK